AARAHRGCGHLEHDRRRPHRPQLRPDRGDRRCAARGGGRDRAGCARRGAPPGPRAWIASAPMLFPTADAARPVLATVRSVFDGAGGFGPTAGAVFGEIARAMYGEDPDALGAAPETLRPDLARQAVMLMALLEYTAHPLRPEVADAVR